MRLLAAYRLEFRASGTHSMLRFCAAATMRATAPRAAQAWGRRQHTSRDDAGLLPTVCARLDRKPARGSGCGPRPHSLAGAAAVGSRLRLGMGMCSPSIRRPGIRTGRRPKGGDLRPGPGRAMRSTSPGLWDGWGLRHHRHSGLLAGIMFSAPPSIRPTLPKVFQNLLKYGRIYHETTGTRRKVCPCESLNA